MGIKIAFVQLGSCWGCHQSLVDLHEELLDILPALEIVYWQAVVDTKDKQLEAMPDGSITIGMVEGQVRTEHDVHMLKLIRKKSQVLIMHGSCACYGSVAGLANLYPIEECTKRKYVTAESVVDNYAIPSENVSKFLDKVTANSEIVKIDAWMPGCPPRPQNYKSAVYFIASYLGAKNYPDTNVCEVCEMRGADCLLKRGKLCFGPITAAAPGVKWPKGNKPVLGEWGISTKPADPEAVDLAKLAISVPKLADKHIAQIIEFATIALRLPNLGQVHLDANVLEIAGLRKLTLPTKDVLGAKAVDLTAVATADPPILGPLAISILTGIPELTRDIIGVALLKLVQNEKYNAGQSTVCDQCDRFGPNMAITGYKRDFQGIMDPNICFLNQGYMCMGFLTNNGCGGICPNKANMVCSGCFGITQELIDNPEKIQAKVSELCKKGGISADGLMKQIKDPTGLIYRYTNARAKKPENFGG